MSALGHMLADFEGWPDNTLVELVICNNDEAVADNDDLEPGAVKTHAATLGQLRASPVPMEALFEVREAAAHTATSFLVGDPSNGVPLRSPSPHEIADAIRKLPLPATLPVQGGEEERARIVTWLPIESAPKDGTKFDAWVPDAFGGHRMTNLSFNARGQLRQHGLLTPADLPRWPTHWMPLPPAPGSAPVTLSQGGEEERARKGLHPSHETRDEICVNCGATDGLGSWRALSEPCPAQQPAVGEE